MTTLQNTPQEELFIWYDGPRGSGRLTSIETLLNNHNPYIECIKNRHTMLWTLSNYDYVGEQRKITISYGMFRKFEPYDDADKIDPSEPPKQNEFVDENWDESLEWHHEKICLKKLNGIIFVASLDPSRKESNKYHLARLWRNLQWAGRDPKKIPMVFQLNFMDLEDKIDIEEIKKDLKWYQCIYQPSIAYRQQGVKYAMDSVIKMVEAKNKL
jgi:hypothetical protein